MYTISNFKKLAKITTLLVIQAFLSVEFGMNAGPVAPRPVSDHSNLAPQVGISNISLQEVMIKITEKAVFIDDDNGRAVSSLMNREGHMNFQRINIIRYEDVPAGKTQLSEKRRGLVGRAFKKGKYEDFEFLAKLFKRPAPAKIPVEIIEKFEVRRLKSDNPKDRALLFDYEKRKRVHSGTNWSHILENENNYVFGVFSVHGIGQMEKQLVAVGGAGIAFYEQEFEAALGNDADTYRGKEFWKILLPDALEEQKKLIDSQYNELFYRILFETKKEEIASKIGGHRGARVVRLMEKNGESHWIKVDKVEEIIRRGVETIRNPIAEGVSGKPGRGFSLRTYVPLILEAVILFIVLALLYRYVARPIVRWAREQWEARKDDADWLAVWRGPTKALLQAAFGEKDKFYVKADGQYFMIRPLTEDDSGKLSDLDRATDSAKTRNQPINPFPDRAPQGREVIQTRTSTMRLSDSDNFKWIDAVTRTQDPRLRGHGVTARSLGIFALRDGQEADLVGGVYYEIHDGKRGTVVLSAEASLLDRGFIDLPQRVLQVILGRAVLVEGEDNFINNINYYGRIDSKLLDGSRLRNVNPLQQKQVDLRWPLAAALQYLDGHILDAFFDELPLLATAKGWKEFHDKTLKGRMKATVDVRQTFINALKAVLLVKENAIMNSI